MKNSAWPRPSEEDAMFPDALKTVAEPPPNLLDIAQIVARGLGPEQAANNRD